MLAEDALGRRADRHALPMRLHDANVESRSVEQSAKEAVQRSAQIGSKCGSKAGAWPDAGCKTRR
jgi:hypothetical protein